MQRFLHPVHPVFDRSLRASGALLAPVALFVAGCRSYESSPLALDAYRATLAAREASAPEVAEFARSIAPTGDGAEAAPFDATDGLSVSEAELVALVFNAGLREARLAAGVAAASAANAGRWDDPTIGVDITRILDGGDWEAIGGFSLTVPLSGRLEIEKAQAGAEQAVALERVAAEEWRVRAEVRGRFAAVAAAEARLAAAVAFVGRLEEIVRVVEAMEARGEVARIEWRLFAIERAEALSARAALEAELEHARLDLARVLGLVRVPTLSIAGIGDEIDAPRRLAPEDSDESPEVRVARAEYLVAERALELEIRRQWPDLVVGPGYGKQDGDRQFELGLSVPIPVLSANARAIAEAESARELARARVEHAVARFILDAAEAEAHAVHAIERRTRIEREIVPLVDAQQEEVRRVVALGGEVSAIVVLESIKKQHAMRLELIDARLEEADARIRLDALAGDAPAGAEVKP